MNNERVPVLDLVSRNHVSSPFVKNVSKTRPVGDRGEIEVNFVRVPEFDGTATYKYHKLRCTVLNVSNIVKHAGSKFSKD